MSGLGATGKRRKEMLEKEKNAAHGQVLVFLRTELVPNCVAQPQEDSLAEIPASSLLRTDSLTKFQAQTSVSAPL